jgi:hypothetical protein
MIVSGLLKLGNDHEFKGHISLFYNFRGLDPPRWPEAETKPLGLSTSASGQIASSYHAFTLGPWRGEIGLVISHKKFRQT